ncbi:MAG: glycosyltransferase family 2 protein [Flavobacteriales bacterium]|nr:glycosyltransferase family 2 protein [Flavobacteriales bacterium]
MKTALLISTYNWPEALELVLKSVAAQSQLPDELLIADDGSTQPTTDLINAFKEKSSIPVIHVWHEDDGFRRSAILNKAVARSSADYIVQTDGDCIIHPDFIKDHARLAQKNTYLYGSRVSIKEEAIDRLFESKNIDFSFFSEGIKKRSRTLRFPLLSALYRPKNELSRKLRGCNVSFWRDDFIKVNGYNEAMTGWGREDSELIIRMMNTGISGKRIRYSGIVYHIWHPTTSKSNLNTNDAIQQRAIDEQLTRCEDGVDKYL